MGIHNVVSFVNNMFDTNQMQLDYYSPHLLIRESRISNSNASTGTMVNVISKRDLQILPSRDRHIFTGIFIIILIVGIFLNIKAIFSILKRNQRCFQKTCIISLALSDLISIISISTNNLETFSHPYINWTMGSVMCSLVPLGQFFGIIASSIALLVIAMDRYRNIVKAINKRWDPKPIYCIVGAVLGWIICGALSMPMVVYYRLDLVVVIFLDDNGQTTSNGETMYLCGALYKDALRDAYIIMIVCVFTPLLIIFFWFYYNIAKLIWHHRKPVTALQEQRTDISVTDNSCTQTSDLNKTSKDKIKPLMSMNKTIQMERKIRTFKIIIVLTASFVLCRLPIWIFTCLKLCIKLSGFSIWRFNYFMIALNELSCICNPLLYTYLNTTVSVARRIYKALKDFVSKVFCCFCSNAEFEDYERGNMEFIKPNLLERVPGKHVPKNPKVQSERTVEVELKSNDQYSQNNGEYHRY